MSIKNIYSNYSLCNSELSAGFMLYPYFPYTTQALTNPESENKMLTEMDKLVIDSMMQNGEGINTILLMFSAKFSASNSSVAERYLNFKQLRSEIEEYIKK